MLLDIALTNNARESMEQYMEDLDRDNLDEDPFDDWAQEFTNTSNLWWDFNESELTISNINTLIGINNLYMAEYGSDPAEDVFDLLRRFGLWQIQSGETESYRQMWTEMWDAKFSQDNNQE
jgi:hypothetical protein